MRRPLPVLLALLLGACATSGAFRAGEQAERRQDYDAAVLEYSKALKEHPENRKYQTSLSRARLRASEAHATTARRLAATGHFKEALDEFRLALDLNPSANLTDEVRETESARQRGTAAPEIAKLKEQARERALAGLVLGPEAQERLGLVFRGASLKEAYQALGKAAGVNVLFDPAFQDAPVSLDLEDVAFEEALDSLASVGRTFHRVVGDHVLMVVPDTPTKRREYEPQVVKTFFLSNADLKEAIDLLRVVLGARRVAPLPGQNALTINDTPEKVAAAERIVEVLDKRRAEVVVDVEILEVNRSRLKEYGIEITSRLPGIEGVAGGIFPDPRGTTTLDDNPYRKDNLVLSNLPGVIYRLLQTDATTRLLANPQLRTTEGQTAQARFGDQVPVPVTTFAPIAQGGVSQQAITSFEYKNVGVNIDITPRVHHDGEVSLVLKLDISAVGPAGFQGLPTFNSRTVTSMIRLKDGETNILAGLISDQERRSLSGIPGLASLPFLGRLFARNKDENSETDIVMTLTPHVVKRPALTREDFESFEVGADAQTVLFEAPVIPPPPALAPQRPEPPRVEPIRPPAPTPAPPPPPEP
ncbi:MAG TPA: secretin N-terminal domain-containing protein [Vicinamibacteria bacterium]|nr:secretin N-terminal domain-containing protein [Vicinamibacteria bacterium]